MPPKDLKVSIVLTGSVDNRSMPELVAPLVQQGESPKLIKSTNTRLSKTPGSCARAPKFTRIAQFAAGTKRWGIIPSKLAKNAVLPGGATDWSYYLPGDGGELATLSPGEGLSSSVSFGTFQEAFVPARITAAGALDTVPSETHVAISYNASSGFFWRAYPSTEEALGLTLYVSAWSIEGESLTPPVFVTQTAPSVIRWIGLTSHGALGDRVWFTDTSGICYRTLEISSRSVIVGPVVVVVAPGQAQAGVDVMSDGGQYAYLAHAQNGSTTGATVRRVDVTNGSTTHSANIAGALAGGGKCAVHRGTINGAARVGVAFSRATGAKTTIALYDSTLSVVGAPFERDGFGDVAVGFCEDPVRSAREVVALVSVTQGDFATIAGSPASITTSFLGTVGYVINVNSWGAGIGEKQFPWLILQSHCSHWQHGAGQFPVVFFGRSYGNTNNTPGGANYVDDPSITAYLWASYDPRPVARFGVVRNVLAPAYTAAQACLVSRSCFVSGDAFTFAYRKLPKSFKLQINATNVVAHGRFVTFDLAPHQPQVAHDKDGCALFSGAAPAQFDGDRYVEIGGPYHAPKLAIKAGTGPVLAPGTYRFAAHYEWTDNAGVVHRSRVSNIEFTIVGGSPSLGPGVFASSQDGFNALDFGRTYLLFYGSDNTGKGLFLIRREPVIRESRYRGITINSVPNAADGNIYSSGSAGEELMPQPAPPLRDIYVIGPRAWGIDAEIPTRIVPSKLRIAGVGYEFSPFLEVNLPSDAGEAHAIRGWQGLAIVLCERGVYQIAGDGPNNSLTQGEFSQPIKLSDIVCTNGPSAVAFPGGVVWQSGQRFALLAGGGVDFLPNFNAEYEVMHAMLLRRYEEVLFFSNSVTEVRAYNHALQRWTTWDSQVLEGPVTAAALLPYDEDRAFVYSEATGFVYRLEADSVSTCANMTWETDWTLLGGDFQDHVLLRNVIFNGTILGPHSITIEVYCDYESAPSTVRTWSSSELSGLANGGRYTVNVVDPKEINCRAVKLKLYDTVASGEVDRRGVQPRSLTIVYALDGMLYETAFVEGSRK